MGSGDCRVGVERAAKDVVPESEPGELRKRRPRSLDIRNSEHARAQMSHRLVSISNT